MRLVASRTRDERPGFKSCLGHLLVLSSWACHSVCNDSPSHSACSLATCTVNACSYRASCGSVQMKGSSSEKQSPSLVKHSILHIVEHSPTIPSVVSKREEGFARPHSKLRRTGCPGKGRWLRLRGGDELGLDLGIRQDFPI